MTNTFKKIISGVLIAAIFSPLLLSAQTTSGETPFGGMHLVTLDDSICDCGGNSHWILDYTTDDLLMLYYADGGSKLFQGYNLEGTYEVGTYQQGGEPCDIEIGEGCYSLENNGQYGSAPGTGTTYSMLNGNTAGVQALFSTYKVATKTTGSYFSALKNTTAGILKGLN